MAAACRTNARRGAALMHKHSKVSVILPTYNEKESIRQVINDFENIGVVDEILVINNRYDEIGERVC